MRRRARQLAMCFPVLLVAGCAAITTRNALPEAAVHVEPDGFHNIRYWGDETAIDAAPSPRIAVAAAEPSGRGEKRGVI
jgi:hypothetical protein